MSQTRRTDVFQTCKELYNVEKAFYDAIWNSCLSRICRSNEMFASTYKWRPRSPKTREFVARRVNMVEPILENARKAKSDDPPKSDAFELIYPHDTPEYDPDTGEEYGFQFIELLPGGRFLLLVTRQSLYVWDFAPYLEGLAAPVERKLALPLHYAHDTQVLPSLGPDSTSVRLLICIKSHFGEFAQLYGDWDSERLRVYWVMELSFGDDDLRLRKIGEFPILYPPSDAGDEYKELCQEDLEFSEEIIIFRILHTVVLWNVVKNGYTVWELDKRDPPAIRYQMVAVGGNVLIFEDNSLIVYEVPPLVPLPAPGSALDLAHPPTTPIPRQTATVLPGYALVCDSKCEPWKASAGYFRPPLFYVRHVNPTDATTRTAWYNIAVDMDSPMPVQVTELGWDTVRDPAGYEKVCAFERPCNGKVIGTSIWRRPLPHIPESMVPQAAFLRVSLSKPSPRSLARPKSQPHESMLYLLTRIEGIDWSWDDEVSCDFCPLSGILVVVSRRFRGEHLLPAKRVQVFDLIRPLLR
ncbi:hypothetical protein CC2G_008345 [Coprinopsis cinerea AmutBmut pab1-1]|nr:hypothetical protein CC2G_008345 [Coprinopsis cinerea AmutBmut pab1-1]